MTSGTEAMDAIGRRNQELLDQVKHPSSPLYLHTLMDALVALYDECTRVDRNAHAHRFVDKYQTVVARLKKARMSMDDFKVIKTLGRGAFGEVNLVKCRSNNKFYAIKKLNKAEMLTRSEAFFMEEKDLLGLLHCDWVTNLEYAFQDDDYLYLVMEYLAGGNMLSLLFRQGSFDEDTTRIYLAEAVLGIQKIHEQGYVYRDLKPENMLFDKDGHIKLADFGSCYKLNKEGFVDSQVAAGTPDYLAPEVLKNNEGLVGVCGKESDWWSLGIVLYEMLCADPPFMADSLLQTYSMILAYKEHFKFPDDVELSDNAKSLIKGLITDRVSRLTYEQIVAHPFFASVDWSALRKQKAPFVPELKGPDDTTYFEDEDLPDLPPGFLLKHTKKGGFSGENFPFVGYSYSRSLPRLLDLAGTVKNVVVATTAGSAAAGPDRTAAKAKEEIERLQQRLQLDKQRFQLDQRDLEGKLKRKLAELETKEQEVLEEIRQRKKAQESARELEKQKVDLEVQTGELRRKLEKLQEAKAQDAARIADLEEQVQAAKTMLAQMVARKAEAETTMRQFQEVKSQFDQRVKEYFDALAQSKELKSKGSLLEMQVQKFAEVYEAAKRERADLLAEVTELEEENSELMTKAEEHVDIIKALTAVHEQLSASVDGLQTQEAQQRRAVQDLQAEKQRLQAEKTRLAIELQELSSKITIAREREAELLAQLEKHDLQASGQEVDAELTERVERYQQQLKSERAAKEALLAKQAEMTAELQRLTFDAASVAGRLEEATRAQEASAARMQDAQRQLEVRAAEVKRLEAELEELRAAADAAAKSLKEATNQKQREEEKATKLEERVAELEQERADVSTKTQALQAELEALVDKSKATDRRLTEITSGALVRVGSEELLSVKQSLTKEISGVKAKLEIASRHSLELDEQLSKLQKEKAKSDIERSQLEKELASEKQRRQTLEEKATRASQALDRMKSTSLLDLDQIDELGSRLEELQAKTKKRDAQRKELEALVEELTQALEAAQVELENAKSKAQGAPRSEVKEKKEFRKLREEFSLLQMRLQNEELAKRTMTAAFDETTQQNERLEAEIEHIKKQIEQAKQDRFKAPAPEPISAKPSAVAEDPAPTGGTSHGMFNSLRKSFSSIRRPKADVVFTFNAGSLDKEKDFHFTPTGAEGHLRVPKDGKISKGWAKKFVVIQNYELFVLDKEKDKEKVTPADALADLRWPLFLCKEASEATIKEKKEDLGLAFTLQAKAAPSTADPKALNNTEIGLTPVQIHAKMKAIEKEIQIEEGILKGGEKMVKISFSQKKGAQQQLEGSKKKLEQLRQHHARLRLQLEAASNKQTKKIQLVQESIASEEKYQASLKSLLDLADTEEELTTTTGQLEDSVKKLAELKRNLEKAQTTQDSSDESLIGEELQFREFNGHRYKLTTFDNEAHCHYCNEAIVKRQGLFCLQCDHICHKECHTLGGLSCADRLELRSVPMLVFQAVDVEERKKWIEAINSIRENHTKSKATPL